MILRPFIRLHDSLDEHLIGSGVHPKGFQLLPLGIIDHRPGIIDLLFAETIAVIHGFDRLIQRQAVISQEFLRFLRRQAELRAVLPFQHRADFQIIESGENIFFGNAVDAGEHGPLQVRIVLQSAAVETAKEKMHLVIIPLLISAD